MKSELATLPDEDIAVALLYNQAPELSADEKVGLIRRLGARAGVPGQKIGLNLLRGFPRQLALVGSGISIVQLNRMCKADPEFAADILACEESGFASGPLYELYRRAMAGAEDRGSLRALEIIVKARMPEYGEKFAHEHRLIRDAEDSITRAGATYEAAEEAGQFA